MVPGRLIRAAEVGILAALGHCRIRVVKQPRVFILATGDELIGDDGNLGPGQIRESNSHSLLAQVREAGGLGFRLGIAKDKWKDLEERMRTAPHADILLVSGGVSVGKYDIVRETLLQIGVKPFFWKVAIRPGKPLFFGVLGKTLIFGLPGYPASSFITFEEFVRPAILALLGCKPIHRSQIKAVLREEIRKPKGIRSFLRVRLEYENGRYLASLSGSQKSSVLSSLANANGIAVISEEVEVIPSGGWVEVQLLGEVG
jgi:molybdopterin molybdotransferase